MNLCLKISTNASESNSKRRIFVGSTFCILLLCIFNVTLAHAQTKIAFVAGVEKYQKDGFRPLNYAEDDAQDLKQALKDCGFEVTDRIGAAATRDGINAGLAVFYEQAAKLTRNDLAIVYFSGHGVQKLIKTKENPEGVEEPYFCPIDALKTKTDTMISINEVIRNLQDSSGSSYNMLLVDACRTVVDKGSKGIDGSIANNLRPKLVVLLSSSSGQSSYESKSLEHGIFTHFLIEGLQGEAANKSGNVTNLGLLRYVTEEVSNGAKAILTRDEIDSGAEDPQTPNWIGNVTGTIVISKLDPSKLAAVPKNSESNVLSGNRPLETQKPKPTDSVATTALYDLLVSRGDMDEISLFPGELAPKLPALKFFEGQAFTQIEPGKVYVFNVFANWCGPCLTAIPGLSRLQQKYPSVMFVELDTQGEEDAQRLLARPVVASTSVNGEENASTFSEWWQGKLGYRFCAEILDSSESSQFSANWMDAAGMDAIPTSFVVDQQGRIAWIGHPRVGESGEEQSLDEIVGQIVAGTWDREKARIAFVDQSARATAIGRIALLRNEEKYDEAIDRCHELAAHCTTPEVTDTRYTAIKSILEMEIEANKPKYMILETFNNLLTDFGNDAKYCDILAWQSYNLFLENSFITKELLSKVASLLEVASVGAEPLRRSSCLETLAYIEAELGDLPKAIELQQEAISIAPTAEVRVALESSLRTILDRANPFRRAGFTGYGTLGSLTDLERDLKTLINDEAVQQSIATFFESLQTVSDLSENKPIGLFLALSDSGVPIPLIALPSNDIATFVSAVENSGVEVSDDGGGCYSWKAGESNSMYAQALDGYVGIGFGLTDDVDVNGKLGALAEIKDFDTALSDLQANDFLNFNLYVSRTASEHLDEIANQLEMLHASNVDALVEADADEEKIRLLRESNGLQVESLRTLLKGIESFKVRFAHDQDSAKWLVRWDATPVPKSEFAKLLESSLVDKGYTAVRRQIGMFAAFVSRYRWTSKGIESQRASLNLFALELPGFGLPDAENQLVESMLSAITSNLDDVSIGADFENSLQCFSADSPCFVYTLRISDDQTHLALAKSIKAAFLEYQSDAEVASVPMKNGSLETCVVSIELPVDEESALRFFGPENELAVGTTDDSLFLAIGSATAKNIKRAAQSIGEEEKTAVQGAGYVRMRDVFKRLTDSGFITDENLAKSLTRDQGIEFERSNTGLPALIDTTTIQVDDALLAALVGWLVSMQTVEQ